MNSPWIIGDADSRRHNMTFVVTSSVSNDRHKVQSFLFWIWHEVCSLKKLEPLRTSFHQEEENMSRIAEIKEVMEGARQQRAKIIGSALQAHALPIAAVVAISLALLTLAYEPTAEAVFRPCWPCSASASVLAAA